MAEKPHLLGRVLLLGGHIHQKPENSAEASLLFTAGVDEFEELGKSDQRSSLEEGENSESESQDSESSRHNRHRFPVEDTEGLFRAIYASEDILEPPTQMLTWDKIYRALGKPQSKVFTVLQTLKEDILREWKDPERKALKLKTWKSSFPFGEEEEEKFFKIPNMDPQFCGLPFEGSLLFGPDLDQVLL